MDKKLNNKKSVTVVGAIGDCNKVINELEQKAREHTKSENLLELNKVVKNLRSNYEQGNYDNSSIIKKHIKNKTGKYIVFCKDDTQVEKTVKKCFQMFENINGVIDITPLRKNMKKNTKSRALKKFKEKDNNSLKILVLNNNSKIKYDISDMDGAVLLDSPTNWYRGVNKSIYKALEYCKDDATIINFIDNLSLLTQYNGIKNILSSEFGDEINFIDEKSLVDAENVRQKTFNDRTSEEFILNLMREYKKETGKEVTVNTVYNGYNLGAWKNNLRQKYLDNTLEMDEKILEEFEKEGILGERKRAVGASDEEKFNILKNYKEKYPDRPLTTTTVDDNNVPIGRHKWSLQVNVNAKKSTLTEEQIDYLKQNGILNYSKAEIKEFAEKYNISERMANVITMEHGSIDKFIQLYKEGKANLKYHRLNKRGIIVSKNEISQKQKQSYIRLIEAVFGKDALEDTSKFVIQENIVSAIDKLSDKEKNILFKKVGINGEKLKDKEIVKETGTSRAYIFIVYDRALKKLSKTISVHSIDSLNRLKDKFTNELEKVFNMSENEWQDYNMNKDIKYLKFSENLTKKLKENGFNTLKDLSEVSVAELREIPTVGNKKVNIILNEIRKHKNIKRADKIKKIENMLSNINGKISGYNNAYEYYMENENIFSQDVIIPPSIIEQSSLSKKKDEKIEKQNELKQLDSKIDVQDKKTQKLEEVLDSLGGIIIEDKKIEE